MADAPFTWEPPATGAQGDRTSWFRRHPWYVTVPVIGALWLVIAVLVFAVLVPVFFGGFGADEAPAVQEPARIERQAPARAPATTTYNGPAPCAQHWPTTCDEEGR